MGCRFISEVLLVTLALASPILATVRYGGGAGGAVGGGGGGYVPQGGFQQGAYRGSGGYGGGYYGGGGGFEAPRPFEFNYNAPDEFGNAHYRQESGDGSGAVRGSYGYTDSQGLYRHVDYVADAGGFRANVRTNEPGTESQNPNPADVNLNAVAPPAGIYGSGGARGGFRGGYGGGVGGGYGGGYAGGAAVGGGHHAGGASFGGGYTKQGKAYRY